MDPSILEGDFRQLEINRELGPPQRKHPLLIDLILDKVLLYLIPTSDSQKEAKECEFFHSSSRSRDVYNIRLVCKLWKERATRLLREKMPICHFHSDGSMDGAGTQLRRFIQLMRSSSMVPAQKFAIHGHWELSASAQEVLEICVSSAVDLYIELPRFELLHALLETNFSFKSEQRLKTLKIKFGNAEESSNNEEKNKTVPCFVDLLLTVGSRLEQLELLIPFDTYIKESHVSSILFSIYQKFPASVKVLRVDVPYPDVLFTVLCQRVLKLRHFELNVGSPHALRYKEFLQIFFDKQTQFMKTLRLGGKAVEYLSYLTAPLQELLQLKLSGSFFVPVSFITLFPKLEVLDMTELQPRRSSLSEALGGENQCHYCQEIPEVLPSLQEIRFPDNLPHSDVIAKAARCFPKVTRLFISRPQQTVECLQEVFLHFPDIEELTVDFNYARADWFDDGDALLSGVSVRDCEDIKQDGNFQNVSLEGLQRRPSLLNLTKLRKLVLRNCRDRVLLTDFSAYFVFWNMPKLEELHCDHIQINEALEGLLCSKLKILNFNLESSSSFSCWSNREFNLL